MQFLPSFIDGSITDFITRPYQEGRWLVSTEGTMSIDYNGNRIPLTTKGDTGEQGEKGDTGATGPQGPPDTNGTNGVLGESGGTVVMALYACITALTV